MALTTGVRDRHHAAAFVATLAHRHEGVLVAGIGGRLGESAAGGSVSVLKPAVIDLEADAAAMVQAEHDLVAVTSDDPSHRAECDAQVAQLAKDEAVARHDDTFHATAQLLESLLLLTGQKGLAEWVRPSLAPRAHRDRAARSRRGRPRPGRAHR